MALQQAGSMQQAGQISQAQDDIIPYVVEGRVFPSMQTLLNFLNEQYTILNSDNFKYLMNRVVIAITEHSHKIDYDNMLFFELAKSKIANFANFRRTSEFKDNWDLIEKRHKAGQNNLKARQKAASLVIENWGEAGRALVKISSAHGYTTSLGKLAKWVEDYDDFIPVLNHVIFDRLTERVRRGVPANPDPGPGDLQRVVTLLKGRCKGGKIIKEKMPNIIIITLKDAEQHGLTFDSHSRLISAEPGQGFILGTLSEIGTPSNIRFRDAESEAEKQHRLSSMTNKDIEDSPLPQRQNTGDSLLPQEQDTEEIPQQGDNNTDKTVPVTSRIALYSLSDFAAD